MGSSDSTSNKQRSSLACLIKKRIVGGEFFSQTSNLYVAKYIGRSPDVRDDYEATLKLSLYYNAKVNVEYTKIGIVSYFKEVKKFHMLLQRPYIALPSGGDTGNNAFLQQKRSNLIGTPATVNVIDHQDVKIKEYTNDYGTWIDDNGKICFKPKQPVKFVRYDFSIKDDFLNEK